MRIKKKIILMIVLTFGIILGLSSNVAAAESSLTASSTNVNVGDNVTITFSYTGASWNVKVSGNGVENYQAASQTEDLSEKTNTKTLSLNTSNAGTYTINATGDITDANGVTSPVSKSVTVTVNNPAPPANTDTSNNGQQAGNQQQNDPPKSTITKEEKTKSTEEIKQEVAKSRNNYLASLTTSVGSLTPEFNRDTQEYTLTFPDGFDYKSLTSISIDAKLEDNTAKINGGTGNHQVVEGENSYSIRVTAEADNYRTYVIKFTKPTPVKESDLRLSELKVVQVNKDGTKSDLKLNEAFNKDNLVYTASVESAITQLLVTATPENANDISVEVKGADELKEGSNEILITLTSKKDESVKTTYKITVLKDAEVITTIGANTVDKNAAGNIKKNKGFDTIITIFIVVVAILFAVLVTLIVIYKKKNKKRRYQDQEIKYDDVRDLVNKYAKEESEKNVLDDINEENDLDKYNDSEEDTSLFSRFRDEEDEKDEKEDTVIFKTEDEDSEKKDLGEEEDNKIEDDLVQENEQFKNEKIEDISADEEERIDWDVISREDKKAEDFDDSSAWDEAEKQKSIQDWLNIGDISSDDDNTPTPPPTKGRKSGGKRFK